MGTFVPVVASVASRKIGCMDISITDAAAGVGCAVLASSAECGMSLARVTASIEARVGGAVEVLGLFHVDGDGRRGVAEACAHGVTMVGFRVLTAMLSRTSVRFLPH